MAGAAKVVAADIDPWAETAVRLNAGLNQVEVDFTGADLIGDKVEADILLAGDVFYRQRLCWSDRSMVRDAQPSGYRTSSLGIRDARIFP